MVFLPTEKFFTYKFVCDIYFSTIYLIYLIFESDWLGWLSLQLLILFILLYPCGRILCPRLLLYIMCAIYIGSRGFGDDEVDIGSSMFLHYFIMQKETENCSKAYSTPLLSIFSFLTHKHKKHIKRFTENHNYRFLYFFDISTMTVLYILGFFVLFKLWLFDHLTIEWVISFRFDHLIMVIWLFNCIFDYFLIYISISFKCWFISFLVSLFLHGF